tara:strand:- start:342 stop:521 length:180 start_codon:yes stop_codon:yes gene_type:complete
MLYQIIFVDENNDVRNGGTYRSSTGESVDIEARRRSDLFTEVSGKRVNWAMSLAMGENR